MDLHFLKFHPILKQTIWGGDKILKFKGQPSSKSNVGESWEISSLPGSESVVSEGPLEGKTISELVDYFGQDLIGTEVKDNRHFKFPLLIKFIDACQDLSIQVHPNDEMAWRNHHSSGKTEMWYIVETGDDALITSGLKPEVDREECLKSMHRAGIADKVNLFKSKPGDVFYIPSGRVHSIGAGNFLVEVQQSSDLTYRLYDFDRKDANGNLRELHIKEGIEAIDFADNTNCGPTNIDSSMLNIEEPGIVKLLESPYFKISEVDVEGSRTIEHTADSFCIFICVGGEGVLSNSDDETMPITRGETVLVPAIYNKIIVTGNVKLLFVTP